MQRFCLPVAKFWGRGFSPSSITEVPGAPLYKTASPVRAPLQRGCFCGGSLQGLLNVFPSQIQTFSAVPGNCSSFPTLSPGVGAGSWGCRAMSFHTPLPQTSHPGLDTLSHPSPTPPAEAQKRALNWSWGVGRGTRKDLIPWMSLMAPALPQSTTGQDWGPVLAGQLHTSPLSLENHSPIFLLSSDKRCVCVCMCVCVLRLCQAFELSTFVNLLISPSQGPSEIGNIFIPFYRRES